MSSSPRTTARPGSPAQARRVLYARERLRRDAKAPLGRAWSLLQDLTVGYGYQPWRAALWLTLLLAAGSILFAAAAPAPLLHGATPHFNAVIYTLDLLLPVVDLGQKHAFNPAGAEQWFSYVLIAARLAARHHHRRRCRPGAQPQLTDTPGSPARHGRQAG